MICPDFFYGQKMSVAKIIRHFEGLGRLPIELSEVVQQVQSYVLDDKIEVHAVDMPTHNLRGFHLRREEAPHSDSAMMPRFISVAAYSINQPVEWQRLVCCKELIHCLDRDPIKTRKRDDVVRLGKQLCEEDGSTPYASMDLQAFFDGLAKYQALAILFPFGLREELLDAYDAGKVSLEQIAGWVQLPVEYVRVVMTKQWALLRESILDAG